MCQMALLENRMKIGLLKRKAIPNFHWFQPTIHADWKTIEKSTRLSFRHCGKERLSCSNGQGRVL